MENIEKVSLFVKSLDSAADLLKLKLKPVLSKSLEELVATTSNNVEKIKIYNSYCYILISVIFAYMKSIGINTDKHPIMKELNRIKVYMKRLKDHETNANKQDTSKQDAENAKKFLQNTLGSKINGGGAAAPNELTSPAISSSNFKGTHKKFTDENSEDESRVSKIIEATTKKSTRKKANKVVKPKK